MDPRLALAPVLLTVAGWFLWSALVRTDPAQAASRRNLVASRHDTGGSLIGPVPPRPGGRHLAEVGRRLTPATSLSRLSAQLAAADLGRRWTIERVLTLKVILAVAVAAGAGYRFTATGSGRWLLAACVGSVVAFIAPDLQIADKARQRSREIEAQLPGVIDQITVIVESGLGFDNALQQVVDSGHGPLVDELRRALQDMELGASRNEALSALADRTPLLDLRVVLRSIVQSTEYGISIGTVLRAQSKEVRDKRYARAQEEAQKIPVKIVLPMLFCIFPALFIVLLGPAVARIVDSGLLG